MTARNKEDETVIIKIRLGEKKSQWHVKCKSRRSPAEVMRKELGVTLNIPLWRWTRSQALATPGSFGALKLFLEIIQQGEDHLSL
jgi:hypothetical protein